MKSEIKEATYSSRNQYLHEDKHDLDSYFDINFDATILTNYVSGILDEVPFSYHEEFHVHKLNKGEVFSGFVVVLNNQRAISKQIIVNHPLMMEDYKSSFMVVKDDKIFFYINNHTPASNQMMIHFDDKKALNELLLSIRRIININQYL
jgi:hypothetical protein